jgi:hypothetical protein
VELRTLPNVAHILKVCEGKWEAVSTPEYELEQLRLSLVGRAVPGGWFSDPNYHASPNVTIHFERGIRIALDRYCLASGLRKTGYMRTWILYGRVGDDWRELDRREGVNVLSDGEKHEFAVKERSAIEAVRLCHTGRNRLGSLQLHLTEFTLMGDVFGPPEAFDLGCRAKGPDSPVRKVAHQDVATQYDSNDGGDGVERNTESPPVDAEMNDRGGRERWRPLITSLDEWEDVRQLGRGRFGTTRNAG